MNQTFLGSFVNLAGHFRERRDIQDLPGLTRNDPIYLDFNHAHVLNFCLWGFQIEIVVYEASNEEPKIHKLTLTSELKTREVKGSRCCASKLKGIVLYCIGFPRLANDFAANARAINIAITGGLPPL